MSSHDAIKMLEAVVQSTPGLTERHRCEILKAVRNDAAPKIRLLSTRQVCEALGASRQSLWRWRRQGLLSPVKLSERKIRYHASEVEALMQNGIEAVEARKED